MIDVREFDKVCHLAKLSIPEEKREQFLSKLNLVFNWIDQLTKIDTSFADDTDYEDTPSTPERSDVALKTNTKGEILSNTKNKKFDMFCVPKIVE